VTVGELVDLAAAGKLDPAGRFGVHCQDHEDRLCAE
jgi:hypothetical protein